MKISDATIMPFWMNPVAKFGTMVLVLTRCRRHHQQCRRRRIGALGMKIAVLNGPTATIIGQVIGGMMIIGLTILDHLKRVVTPRITRFPRTKTATGPNVVPMVPIMETMDAAHMTIAINKMMMITSGGSIAIALHRRPHHTRPFDRMIAMHITMHVITVDRAEIHFTAVVRRKICKYTFTSGG